MAAGMAAGMAGLGRASGRLPRDRPRRWLRVLSELALRDRDEPSDEGAVEFDAYDEADPLGECETSLLAIEPSRRNVCTGNAGAGGWLFKKRSTAVGSFGLVCVLDRARPCKEGDLAGTPGGSGEGRGASNQGLFGS